MASNFSSSSLTPIETSSDQSTVNEFFVRKDFRYSLRICMRYPHYIDTTEVADFFLEFLMSQDQTISSLEDPRLLKSEFNEDRLRIENVKYAKREITSITSDPDAVYFNLDTDSFNLIFLAADWARRTPIWSDYASFVLENYRQKNQIKAVHTATRKMLMKKPDYKRFPTSPAFDDWRDSVIVWWNEFVDNGYTTKMPQLFLYGPSNVGKTSFIKRLLGELLNFFAVGILNDTFIFVSNMIQSTQTLGRRIPIGLLIRRPKKNASFSLTSILIFIMRAYGMNFECHLASSHSSKFSAVRL